MWSVSSITPATLLSSRQFEGSRADTSRSQRSSPSIGMRSNSAHVYYFGDGRDAKGSNAHCQAKSCRSRPMAVTNQDAEPDPSIHRSLSTAAFLEDLKRRGLVDPLLAITDGAPWPIRAVVTCFPRTLRQRCLVHRLRNLRSKAPETQLAGDRDPGSRLLRGGLAGARHPTARRFCPGL